MDRTAFELLSITTLAGKNAQFSTKNFNTESYVFTIWHVIIPSTMPDTQQELRRPLLNQPKSCEELIMPQRFCHNSQVALQSQNATDSSVQKENYEYLGSDQERTNSDFWGQEVITLISILLIPQKAIKRLILTRFPWLQNPWSIRHLDSKIQMLSEY